MKKYRVYLTSGEMALIEAHHYKNDEVKQQIVFYLNEKEIDPEILVFQRGVIAIAPSFENSRRTSKSGSR